MSHPYHLLANLVDGTLDEDDLAGVQAHLDACGSCRADVADALLGAEAARSLPPEEPPSDLYRRVLDAVGGHGAPSWYRWAGAAAAAAVVLAIAVALPNIGTGGSDERAGLPQQEAETTRGAAEGGGDQIQVEVRDGVDYDAESLQELAKAPGSAAFSEDQAAPQADGVANARAAARCVSRAFQDQELGRLTRIIQARFEGEEAYIAVYLEGPGAEQEPDLVNVLAASRDDCSFLSLAYDTP